MLLTISLMVAWYAVGTLLIWVASPERKAELRRVIMGEPNGATEQRWVRILTALVFSAAASAFIIAIAPQLFWPA